MITADTYLDVATGSLDYENLREILIEARRTSLGKAGARDLGWLVARGYGYDRAARLNPYPNSVLAQAFDSGVAEYTLAFPDLIDGQALEVDHSLDKAVRVLAGSAIALSMVGLVFVVPF